MNNDRDRSFGPAVQAAVERARNASTDPRWDPAHGGLPESPRLRYERTYAAAMVTEARRAALEGTITPPTADPLSPFQRAELERILLDIKVAHDQLAKLLEGP